VFDWAIFLNPGPQRRGGNGGPEKGGRAIMTKLTTIQRKAAILITGAMRTMAGDILDVHADLLPMNIMVDKFWWRAALRMATLPSLHPLFPYIRRAARGRIK
jgi:hypothetical protein